MRAPTRPTGEGVEPDDRTFGQRGVAEPPPPRRPASPAPGSLSDEALAARVSGGDRQALALLVARHDAELRRLCAALMQDEEAGADSAQEAWLRAWSGLVRAPGPPERFRPWLRALARNVCFDVLRRGGGTRAAELDQLVTVGAGPEESLLAREEARLVLGDLRGLPERQREAITGSLSGLSRAQIATRMGVTERQANSLLAEGRRNLARSRTGRALSCDEVRRALEDGRGRNRTVRAHIQACAGCRSHQRQARGRALLARLPLPPALWPLAERLVAPAGADLGAAAGGAVASAMAVVATTVALAGAGGDGMGAGPEPAVAAGSVAPAAPAAPEAARATGPRRAAIQQPPEPRPGPSARRSAPANSRAPSPPLRDGGGRRAQAPPPAPVPVDDRREPPTPPSPPASPRPSPPRPPSSELVPAVELHGPAVGDMAPGAAVALGSLKLAERGMPPRRLALPTLR